MKQLARIAGAGILAVVAIGCDMDEEEVPQIDTQNEQTSEYDTEPTPRQRVPDSD